MAGFGLLVRERGLTAMVKRLGAVGASTPAAIQRAVEQSTRLAERDLKQRAMSGAKRVDAFFGVMGSDPASNTIGVRSGMTRNSVTARTFSLGNRYFGVAGSPAKHLPSLDRGATIAGSPMLRIPLRAAQTGAGVDRNLGRSVRDVGGFFVWPSRAQRAGALSRIKGTYLARSEGGKLVLWYLLKASVSKPARKFMAAAQKRVDAEVQQRFVGLIETVRVQVMG